MEARRASRRRARRRERAQARGVRWRRRWMRRRRRRRPRARGRANPLLHVPAAAPAVRAPRCRGLARRGRGGATRAKPHRDPTTRRRRLPRPRTRRRRTGARRRARRRLWRRRETPGYRRGEDPGETTSPRLAGGRGPRVRRRETRRARPRGRNRARRWRPRRGWCWWFPRWSWTTRGDGETRRGCVDASSTCPPLVQGGHRGNRDARRDAGREAARAPSAPPSKARAATPCPRASSMRRGLETGDPARLRRAVGCGARRGVTSTKSRRRFGHQPSLVASVIVSM